MRKVRIRIGALIRAIVVLGICYIILMPLFTKLSSAFMTERDLYDQTVKWIPSIRHWTISSWSGVI